MNVSRLSFLLPCVAVVASLAACSSNEVAGAVASDEANDTEADDCSVTKSADGWCWATTNHPAGGESFVAFADDDVYGVASNILVHWNGTQWKPAGARTRVKAIWGSSPDELWAVEGWENRKAGTLASSIYRRRSTDADWVKVGDAPGRLFAIWGTSANDIWAAGDSALLMHWDGSAWKVVEYNDGGPMTSSPGFEALHGTASNDVWAVGQRGLSHWDGSAWTRVSGNYRTFDTTRLLRVQAFAPNDVWAGGRGLLAHFDGTEWTNVDIPTVGRVDWTVTSISGSADDVMIGLDHRSRTTSQLFHVQGAAVSPIDLPAAEERYSARVSSLARLPSGSMLFARGAGDIYVRAADGTYTRQTSGPQVSFTSASSHGDFIVATGLAAGAFVVRENGEWKLHRGPGTSVRNVLAFAPGVAVGGDTKGVARFANGATTVSSAPLERDDYLGLDITGKSENDLWVAAENDVYHWQSGTWTKGPSLPEPRVASVLSLVTGKNDELIAGTTNGVFRLDGDSWTLLHDGGGEALLSAADGTLWGADEHGLYRNGALVPASEDVTSAARYVLNMTECSDGRIYAVGSLGTILSFDGTTWKKEFSGTYLDGEAGVTCTSDGTVWLFGDDGMIFKKPR